MRREMGMGWEVWEGGSKRSHGFLFNTGNITEFMCLVTTGYDYTAGP